LHHIEISLFLSKPQIGPYGFDVFGAVQIRHVSILHERGRSLSTQNNAETSGHMLGFAGHSFWSFTGE